MKLVARSTFLLSIGSFVIEAVQATPTPIFADLSRLRLTGGLAKDGTRERKAGVWKEPAMFERAFTLAQEMVGCLVDHALPNYQNPTDTRFKELLDKYYYIHNNQQAFDVVENYLRILHQATFKAFGDEMVLSDDFAKVTTQPIKGKQVKGIFFGKNFSNKGTEPHITDVGRAMIIIHEGIHLVVPWGYNGDYVRINGPQSCEFLDATSYKDLKKQSKKEKKPELLNNVYCVYWKEKHFAQGWKAIEQNCPGKIIGVPDATAAAAYHCVHGHEPDGRGVNFWT